MIVTWTDEAGTAHTVHAAYVWVRDEQLIVRRDWHHESNRNIAFADVVLNPDIDIDIS